MKALKKIFFVLIILSASFGGIEGFAQSPDWLWAKVHGGLNTDIGKGIVRDKNGNLYVTGNFQSSSLIFGKDTLKNSGVAGTYDIFITKYGANGDVVWALNFGGSKNADDDVRDIALDSAGNIYVSGGFKGSSITFGSKTHFNSNKDSADIFIAKFNPQGQVLWSQTFGGNGNDIGNSLTVDPSGNIYVVSDIASTSLTVGTQKITNPEIRYSLIHSMLLIELDSDGMVVWVESANINNNDEINFQITNDTTGNIYITGKFYEKVTFGAFTLKNDPTSNDYTSMFIVKFDAQHNALWAKSFGGTDYSLHYVMPESVIAGHSGNIYITGTYLARSLTFDSLKITNTQSYALFVAKLDSTGKFLWAKSSDGGEAFGSAGAIDNKGDLFITGSFSLKPILFGSKKLYNTGSSDAYVVKYTPEGEILWAQSIGGTSNEACLGICVDEAKNAYVAGYYLSPTISIGTKTFYQEGNGDIFIAKLSANPTAVEDESTTQNRSIIFPNPTKSIFKISNLEPGNWNINIYSLTGEKIYESFLKDSQIIDLSGKAKGTYIYQLLKEGEVLKTGKLVVE